MAPDPDLDAFLKPYERKGRSNRSTLGEDDAALCLIEKMDECWFFGSVLSLPGRSSLRWGRSTDVSPPLPASKSIAFVNPDISLSDFSERGDSDLHDAFARVWVDLSPRRGDGGDLKKEAWELASCGNGLNQRVSSEELLGSEDERLVADLRVKAGETDSQETELSKELKQAMEKLDGSPPSVKDQPNSTTLVVCPTLDAADQTKKVPIPLAPNGTTMGLSQKARRRKERKKKSRGLQHFVQDEMAGFKELGFSFSQDKLTPRVVSLFPGMKVNYGEGKIDPKVSFVASPQYRLYTSPAWWAAKPSSPLYNWQFPDPHEEGVDMKAHLKFWARAVALTILQES